MQLVTLFVVDKDMSWLRFGSLPNLRRLSLAVALLAAPCAELAALRSAAAAEDISPATLVRNAIANEVAASQNNSAKHMFRARKGTPRGTQTRLYVETAQAMAGMTIAYNDKPISEPQSEDEFRRLQHLIADQDDLRRKQKQEHEDGEHTMRILRAMPDAFVYQADGTEPSRTGMGKAGDELVRLKFQPNPRYIPPSRVEQVLMGMRGTVLVDKDACRIAKIDGALFREVSFGWGILGHLDKGGNFLVEQADVGDGTWEITHIQLNFTGKVMMVKSIAIKTDEAFSAFQQVPSDLTFAKGVDLLKQEWAKLQHEETATATAKKDAR